MSRRKTFEELAHTRTMNRLKRIERLIEEIGYDWFDSECGMASDVVDRTLSPSLRDFRAEFAEVWDDYVARELKPGGRT